jgi:hypothetical protein
MLRSLLNSQTLNNPNTDFGLQLREKIYKGRQQKVEISQRFLTHIKSVETQRLLQNIPVSSAHCSKFNVDFFFIKFAEQLHPNILDLMSVYGAQEQLYSDTIKRVDTVRKGLTDYSTFDIPEFVKLGQFQSFLGHNSNI